MRIFVISWFFPPGNSSEGMVTFKLLKSSQHEFVVFSSNQLFWSYDNCSLVSSVSDCKNIQVIYSDRKNFIDWEKDCFDSFFALHKEKKFDAIMSRTMPPETIGIAKRIKDNFPSLPWVASLGDPLSNNPYILNEGSKYRSVIEQIKSLRRKVLGKNESFLRQLRGFELDCLSSADALIFPNETLRDFVVKSKQVPTWVVPHSYDKSLYLREDNNLKKIKKIIVSYIGTLDSHRNPEFLFQALRKSLLANTSLPKKLEIRLYGNFNEELKKLINGFGLAELVKSFPPVSYEESLKIMESSDWLIHIDAFFKSLEETGGSVFFAGKIADYFGTNKPILGLTGDKSPASSLISQAGGQIFSYSQTEALSDFFLKIETNTSRQLISRSFRELFDSKNVAKSFDEKLTELVLSEKKTLRPLVTFCIPCYNSAKYVEKCLESIFQVEDKSSFEVILVNDGSKDNTLLILEKWKNMYPSNTVLIDKSNGGHGSVINAALRQAKGIYFKVVDSDDTVIPGALDSLFDLLRTTEKKPDLISSDYIQFFVEDNKEVLWSKKNNQIPYCEEISFNQFDLSEEFFTLAGTFFKTKLLKSMELEISEKVLYDDMEYVLFPIPLIRTLLFFNQNTYRYLIGRPGQSVSPEVFLKKFNDHEHVINRLLKWYRGEKLLLEDTHRKYLSSVLTSRLIPTHTWLCSQLVQSVNSSNSEELSFNKYLFKNYPDLFWKSMFKSKTIFVSRLLGMQFFRSSFCVLLKQLRKK